MRIGVLTFWWSYDNYGQLLQCYALQKYLEKLGHNVYLIRYDLFKDFCNDTKLKRIKRSISSTIKNFQFSKSRRLREFDVFRDEYLTQTEIVYKSLEELKSNPPSADLYIVGSDQVWSFVLNPLDIYKNIVRSFFLDFGGKSVKRVSYAASWGTDTISQEYKNYIIPLLQEFNGVSVRENSGIELCRQCGVNNAVCVPDPTFLLTANDYLNAFKANTSIFSDTNEKYLFLYLLNNSFTFDKSKIFDFARSKNLKVIYVTGNGLSDSYKKTYATIPEWINLIKNAEYIITNSFHCSVFSTIFKKQYAVIPLSGFYEKLNTRISFLFDLCKIEKRFLNEDDFSILDVSYSVDLQSIKKIGENFLADVLC